MAKKTHADIMEKLSALRPSEPTKTRGEAARKPAAKKVPTKKDPVKKAAPAKSPEPKAQPKPQAPPMPNISFPGFSGFGRAGNAAKIYLGVYESWFQIIRDCNSRLLNNLSSFMNPGRWGQF